MKVNVYVGGLGLRALGLGVGVADLLPRCGLFAVGVKGGVGL
jgi:hypothetical protein